MKVIEKFAREVIDSGTYKEMDYVYLVNKIKALVGDEDEEYDENSDAFTDSDDTEDPEA